LAAIPVLSTYNKHKRRIKTVQATHIGIWASRKGTLRHAKGCGSQSKTLLPVFYPAKTKGLSLDLSINLVHEHPNDGIRRIANKL
jgi:hypothetical protein